MDFVVLPESSRSSETPADVESSAHKTTSFEFAKINIRPIPHAILTALPFLISDIFGVLLAFVLAVITRILLGSDVDILFYISLLPLLSIFLIVYFSAGLYPTIGCTAAEELRLLSLSTSLIFLLLASSTFLARDAERYSRGVFLIAWCFALIILPLGRALMRHVYARRDWWGIPVVILGAGETGRKIVQTLLAFPNFVLRPIIVLDDDPSKSGNICGIPVIDALKYAMPLARKFGIRYAIVAMPHIPCKQLLALLECYAVTFRHLIVVPDLFGFSSMHVPSRDLGGILGLEMRQQLLMPGRMALKRFMDLALTLIGGLAILPLIALIALLIKLDSRGPVFFTQERIGMRGWLFQAWKFRTMIMDAEEHLRALLEKDSILRAEYEQYHKLRNDPRLTRVGRWLRAFSLDELPQLWNVLKGDMSLVGPRAYMSREQSEMLGHDQIILRARPGITGWWQISGRNQVDFEGRLKMDVYYVRNWSPWLDIYILTRTFTVVLSHSGAY